MTRRKPNAEELQRAAREIAHLLTFGYLKGYRGRVADQVEPLLRHYITEYRPRLERARNDRDRRLASAAWQVLWHPHDDATLRRLIAGVQSIRQKWDSEDRWPGDANARDALIRQIRRICESKPARGRAPSEMSRANKLLELLGTGFMGEDSRKGVRRERAELLRDAESTARLMFR